MAAEHDELQARLNTSFDASNAKRMGELQHVATALRAWEKGREAIDELTAMASGDGDGDLAAIAREELAAERQKLGALERNLKVSLTPRHEFADLPCMLEFRPGPGGLEGRYFSDTLFKMYKALCARRGYDAHAVKYEMSESAGDQPSAEGEMPLQEAVLEVRDAGAYDVFRSEAGMHRVQRVPHTESKGRVHTSAVAVWVLPSFEKTGDGGSRDPENPNSDSYIDPAEVRVEVMRARGAGGQHVNTTSSAIRLTHIPTGTVVSMQDHRSQPRNRLDAWRVLRARVASQRIEKREADTRALRESVLSTAQITRGDKMRTYNFQQDRCSDHRSGFESRNLPDVLQGGESLDRVMEAAREWLVDREVRIAAAQDGRNAGGKGSRKA